MRIRAAGILVGALFFRLTGADKAPVRLPTFEASLGIGFNYDLLRDPFEVSFDYPKGFFGLNVPLRKDFNVREYAGFISPGMDSILNDSARFSNSGEFRPTAGARQNPNPTIRVDVPMLGGVASFSSTHNFYLNYNNILGNPLLDLDTTTEEGVSLRLRGTIDVPLNVTTSWETMTFGYAFEVNRYVQLALNLHRHVFTLDMRGKVDADMLGRIDVAMDGAESGGFEVPTIEGDLDYSSDRIYGEAYGHYEAEVWTPTIACKAWRFSLTGRFGFNWKARGKLYAKYSVPFFIDPETFELAYDLEDPETLNRPEVRQRLLENAVDSVVYSTRKKVDDKYVESDLVWKMPTALTMAFDIIPEKLRFSYSKLFGEVAMKLDRIAKENRSPGDSPLPAEDSIVIDYGISVDHIMVLELNLFHSFLNLGIFGMDLRYGEDENLLGPEVPVQLGKYALVPVLSLGTALGTKMQLLLEADILPLPALKTGIYYYF